MLRVAIFLALTILSHGMKSNDFVTQLTQQQPSADFRAKFCRSHIRQAMNMSRSKLAIIALALFVMYAGGYAISRWRGFIVMYDNHIKEDRMSIRATGPGVDVRTNERGKMKNFINLYVYGFFIPIAKIEDLVRGGKSPY
jgi:hypothetical protein